MKPEFAFKFLELVISARKVSTPDRFPSGRFRIEIIKKARFLNLEKNEISYLYVNTYFQETIMNNKTAHYEVVVIGSGFGGTMTALPLADKFKKRDKKEKVIILERGTWWTTPISTVQDKEIKTADRLVENKQPVQFWSSQNHFRGFIDLFTRCFRRTKDVNIFTRLFKRFRNEDGLFDFTRFGTRGFLGLFGGKSDGVTVIRANGVGGGSLIYSNITMPPPDFIFDDERWVTSWDKTKRQEYYDTARHAIGYGVYSMLRAKEDQDVKRIPLLNPSTPADKEAVKHILEKAVNTGLANIVMRSARLNPNWNVKPDANNIREIKQIKIDDSNPVDLPPEKQNRLWLDRARVFQTVMRDLTSDYGAVDLSINDLTPETPFGPNDPPPNYPVDQSNAKNYCDRQSRCNVGCLPGARHTLNKQLMAAAIGTPRHPEPLYEDNLEIKALAEVDVIRALDGRGYEIKFIQRRKEDPSLFDEKTITADIVIVAAGCLGTNEIMLRSKERSGALPNLSDKVGYGFSTNGDYLAFLEKTKMRASIVRGPVTTLFAHFNTDEQGTGENGPTGTTAPDTSLFHTIEDQGIPPALASVVGEGVPLIKTLSRGNTGEVFIFFAVLRYVKKRVGQYIREFFSNNRRQGAIFRSEEELTSNMMCVVGMGREVANAQFRLGRGKGETTLRVSKPGGAKFCDDPIYKTIEKSLERLAAKLRLDGSDYRFVNPFLTGVADAARLKSIALSHPLGGCRMANDAQGGVVDEFGRVFDKSKTGEQPFYEGLYIADASIIPTALGVNPSLTISALALRIADKIIEELPPLN
ncbi:MAG: GMC family oxidoreductase [Thermoleophilaceae bacterium]